MKYGLIGYPLSHSFSQRYFSEKFAKEGLPHSYLNFPIDNIGKLQELLRENADLDGFNVTIPYKEQIIPFLDEIEDHSLEIGAVNTVRIFSGSGKLSLCGYNTDVFGFRRSLEECYAAEQEYPEKALILGTGGASKAVAWVLRKMNIEPHFVSRHASTDVYKTYATLDAEDIRRHLLIVNTTPLGMYPRGDTFPDIPYRHLTGHHLLFDLVYNPPLTPFLQMGKKQGCATCNGEKMLRLQAEKAWEIWNGRRSVFNS
ncbi:MAG: shikimate dehydrogenase [Bacteroidales bacterium]|jgi:shikimate dehydrogenase|nr:shikimate dehydrogenase [Bacteroidales bacterium]